MSEAASLDIVLNDRRIRHTSIGTSIITFGPIPDPIQLGEPCWAPIHVTLKPRNCSPMTALSMIIMLSPMTTWQEHVHSRIKINGDYVISKSLSLHDSSFTDSFITYSEGTATAGIPALKALSSAAFMVFSNDSLGLDTYYHIPKPHGINWVRASVSRHQWG